MPLKLFAAFRQDDGNWSAWHQVPGHAYPNKTMRFVLTTASNIRLGSGTIQPATHLISLNLQGKLTHALAIAQTPEAWLSGKDWTAGGDVHLPANAGPVEPIVDMAAGGREDDRDKSLMHLAVVTASGQLRHCVRQVNGEWTRFAQLPENVWSANMRAARVSQCESTTFVMKTDGSMLGLYRREDGHWVVAHATGWGGDNAGATPHRSFAAVYAEEDSSENVRHYAAVDANGVLLHARRTAEEGSPWGQVTGSGAAGGAGSHWQGAATSVSCQANGGSLHLCATSSTGQLCHCIRTTAGSGIWTPLQRIPGSDGLGGPVRHVSCTLVRPRALLVIAGVEA